MAQESPAGKHLAGGQRYIAIIEDQGDVADAIAMLLSSHGDRCRVFHRAEDYLQEGGADRPDCIVLDLRLPGISGVEFLELLAKSGSGIPVVALTAWPNGQLLEQSLFAGASVVHTKPVEARVLLESITNAIETSQRK